MYITRFLLLLIIIIQSRGIGMDCCHKLLLVTVLPTGGPAAQVCWLGPKVGGRLALFCIHRVHRVNSRNDSVTESWWQHHKRYPGIIIIIIIITVDAVVLLAQVSVLCGSCPMRMGSTRSMSDKTRCRWLEVPSTFWSENRTPTLPKSELTETDFPKAERVRISYWLQL